MAASATVTAVVTLGVTALLTPLGSVVNGAVQDIFGASHPVTDPTKSAAVKLERVADSSRAVSMLAPADWGVTVARVDTPYGRPDADHLGATDFSGVAMITGDKAGLSDPYGWQGSHAYVSASRDAAVRLGLTGADAATLTTWAERFVQREDWTREGCVLAREEHPRVEGYVTAMRRWEDCKGLPDGRFWELAASSVDGSVLVVLQLTLGEVPEATAAEMMSSFTVATERLPDPAEKSGDRAIP